MHVLHQGRAEYTMITPGVNGDPPSVEIKVSRRVLIALVRKLN